MGGRPARPIATARDRTPSKLDFLKARGIGLHAQDGSGVTSPKQMVIASAAVEDTAPDIVAAKKLGAPIKKRSELLAELMNSAPVSVAVGGASDKSTTTGMIGWILYGTRRDPTVMNGAVTKTFVSGDAPFASAIVGEGPVARVVQRAPDGGAHGSDHELRRDDV